MAKYKLRDEVEVYVETVKSIGGFRLIVKQSPFVVRW